MSTQSLFSKKNIKSQQPDSGRGLLEELNLPPELISFIRKNSRNLQIGMICVLILVLGWIFFDYYSEMQEKKGASLLATGLQSESTEERVQVLENVIKEYGRTSAARWSKVELAHLDYKEGKFEAAAVKYNEILDALPAGNPLVPLARLNLAQSYEQAGQLDQAISQYNILKKNTGFTNQAYLGLARMYMAKEDPVQARMAYQGLLSNLEDTSDPVFKSQVEAQLAALDAVNPAILSTPEENKE
jgi:predicted negative regulator of RcsB-dependent stress response